MNSYSIRSAITAGLLTSLAVVAHAQDVTGAGASFPAPVYAKWADAYNKATGARINYQSVGSGAGMKQIGAKTVDFGASDAPLTEDDLAKSGQEPRTERAPLGDNHRVMFPTYSISKIAAETVCRFVAHQHSIPTTIARLSVPYGDNGGWMYFHLLMMQQGIPIDLHPDKPNYYNPLHVDDYIEKIPYLLGAATPEVTTVNFGGSQKVSIEEWCAYIGELTGFTPVFKDNPKVKVEAI